MSRFRGESLGAKSLHGNQVVECFFALIVVLLDVISGARLCDSTVALVDGSSALHK